MEQPSWDADAATWRRFAGELRQRAGAAYRRASEAEARASEAEARAVEAEARAVAAVRETREGLRKRALDAEEKLQGLWERSERWRERHDALVRRKLRDGRLLDKVEALLAEGDYPAATTLLARRRAAIEEATSKRP